MEEDNSIARSYSLQQDFKTAFERLLAGEHFDFYGNEGGIDLSGLFQVIAANLLAEIPELQFIWYDGIVNFSVSIRKSHQIVFKGEMWVGDNRTQWKEDFQAIVTDKSITKQGIWIAISIGEFRAEGKIEDTFR